MQTNHTPGPWDVAMGADYAVYGPGGAPILRIAKGTIPMREDARLIAAAPDLLAALQELLADKYLADPINADRMANARAAIAKAEGKP